jgi:Rrf2 family nitric oxide-sensitive transcriptional repressor
MILSKSADYALRASIHLARNRSSRYIPLNEIAAAMRTPPFLLGRIMQRLVKGDIVISMKGHHGGFRVIREPKNITAAEIIRQVDGRFQMFDCSGIAACGLSGDCTMLEMFERAETALDTVLQTYTLEDLAHTRSSCVSAGNSNLLLGGYIEEVR